jgi:hypothetical protein
VQAADVVEGAGLVEGELRGLALEQHLGPPPLVEVLREHIPLVAPPATRNGDPA